MFAAYIPLQPHTMFHFGEIKADVNVALNHTSHYAPSDILFSALINSYQELTGDASDFVQHFVNGHLAISSLFYYLKKGETLVHLLPRPVFIDLFAKRDGSHKLRNRIKFVSDGVWRQGFAPDNWFDEEKYRFIQDKEILLTTEEYNSLGLLENVFVFKIIDLPKNPIHEVITTPGAKDKSIYYQANVETGAVNNVELGLYFIYSISETSDPQCNLRMKTAVNMLAFSGIGGERNNTGRTPLAPWFDSFELKYIASENSTMVDAFSNISYLNPVNDNDLEDISFNLTVLRGGRETGGAPYKVVRMIKEGALLKKEVKGRLVEIGNDLSGNTAYRNGLGLCLPLKYFKQDERAL